MPLRQIGFYILLTLVLAAFIHVVVIIALPTLAPKTAWDRLVPLGPANTIVALPPAAPGHEVFPMMAPDIRYAFCRFDLSHGPVRLQAEVQSDLWMIAIYTPDGDNFYTVSGADTMRSKLTLVIATQDQNVVEAGADAPEDADQVAVVRSPTRTGIALIRAPLPGPSLGAQAEAALKRSQCGPYRE
jgi:uncharacterized membrane protein